jgi:hypothetical protein
LHRIPYTNPNTNKHINTTNKFKSNTNTFYLANKPMRITITNTITNGDSLLDTITKSCMSRSTTTKLRKSFI